MDRNDKAMTNEVGRWKWMARADWTDSRVDAFPGIYF